jgi:hypothetical protein
VHELIIREIRVDPWRAAQEKTAVAEVFVFALDDSTGSTCNVNPSTLRTTTICPAGNSDDPTASQISP